MIVDKDAVTLSDNLFVLGYDVKVCVCVCVCMCSVGVCVCSVCV